jgi:hypothetical protein
MHQAYEDESLLDCLKEEEVVEESLMIEQLDHIRHIHESNDNSKLDTSIISQPIQIYESVDNSKTNDKIKGSSKKQGTGLDNALRKMNDNLSVLKELKDRIIAIERSLCQSTKYHCDDKKMFTIKDTSIDFFSRVYCCQHIVEENARIMHLNHRLYHRDRFPSLNVGKIPEIIEEPPLP